MTNSPSIDKSLLCKKHNVAKSFPEDNRPCMDCEMAKAKTQRVKSKEGGTSRKLPKNKAVATQGTGSESSAPSSSSATISGKEWKFISRPIPIRHIYPDPTAEALQPRWWHKLIFWKKWSYGEWKIRREYKKLSDLVDEFNGKI